MSQLHLKPTVQALSLGGMEGTLETGELARQASSVKVTLGDAVLLCNVVEDPKSDSARDFSPMMVQYQEKIYSAGRIPGGYFKREGRPTEHETLTSRLIDRPLRPLFPKAYRQPVQVTVTVLSYDPAVQTDVLGIIGASAAMSLAGLPYAGPVSAVRVGYIDGEFVVNPSLEQLESSELNLVVAGTRDAVLMVESEANALSEDIMLQAVMFGHAQMQPAIDAIEALCTQVGVSGSDWVAPESNDALKQKINDACREALSSAYQVAEKKARQDAVAEVRKQIKDQFCPEDAEGESPQEVGELFHDIEADILRGQLLANGTRVDGRDLTTVRPIDIKLGYLPRTHGSALFTRGETQAIVISTLGTDRDDLRFESLAGDQSDRFFLHYNFPPYSVGEAGPILGPKRREIGHGRLARRALEAVLPDASEFPYVTRVVSEITESNGSSSMATVCGGSLSLMDAGVPIKAPVAGIAMGLVKEGDQFAVLTDILGDEDHLGDMDFKVAGTRDGITALQMDIKITGITEDIMKHALSQARDGRMHILSLMEAAIEAPRKDVSEFAPRFTILNIKPDKIRDVIGKGGAVIREITESTNTTIDITDDGVVTIASVNADDGLAAKKRVEEITREAKVGEHYDGKIVKIVDFGAFVELFPGTQGLVHISQICEERVENVSDHLSEGQVVRVKVMEIDRQGKIRLSMKAADKTPENA